jgi:hypothetical protein
MFSPQLRHPTVDDGTRGITLGARLLRFQRYDVRHWVEGDQSLAVEVTWTGELHTDAGHLKKDQVFKAEGFWLPVSGRQNSPTAALGLLRPLVAILRMAAAHSLRPGCQLKVPSSETGGAPKKTPSFLYKKKPMPSPPKLSHAVSNRLRGTLEKVSREELDRYRKKLTPPELACLS